MSNFGLQALNRFDPRGVRQGLIERKEEKLSMRIGQGWREKLPVS